MASPTPQSRCSSTPTTTTTSALSSTPRCWSSWIRSRAHRRNSVRCCRRVARPRWPVFSRSTSTAPCCAAAMSTTGRCRRTPRVRWSRSSTASPDASSPSSRLEVTPAPCTAHCGLVRGSSGGGLFVYQDGGGRLLVGIIFMVMADLLGQRGQPPGRGGGPSPWRSTRLPAAPPSDPAPADQYARLVLQRGTGSQGLPPCRLVAGSAVVWIAVVIVILGPGSREAGRGHGGAKCRRRRSGDLDRGRIGRASPDRGRRRR